MLTKEEIDFTDQSKSYLEQCLLRYGYSDLGSVASISKSPPLPLPAIPIRDPFALEDSEAEALASAFHSESGVSYFVLENWDLSQPSSAVISSLALQLEQLLPLKYPMTHPLERHPAILEIAPSFDGTVKLFDNRTSGAALSTKDLETHVDGLGAVGTVEAAILLMERPPLAGGFTHFRNVARLALDLAKENLDAFVSLFLPDAITVFRAGGSRSIKVTGPALFLGLDGLPKVFLRFAGGEYEVIWREDTQPAQQAAAFFTERCRAFATGTTFVSMFARGHGCIIHNALVAHGRTTFTDGNSVSSSRLLARKWYAATADCQQFRHSPGVWVQEEYAHLFPSYFGADVREGEWIYDKNLSRNVRVR